MTTEQAHTEPAFVRAETTSPHWIYDCPESTLVWWFPLALTAGIYLANTLCILGRHMLIRLCPKPEPFSFAYHNIFRGIDHHSCDDDSDQDFDIMENESFHKWQAYWLDDKQWSESDDAKLSYVGSRPSERSKLQAANTVKSDYSEIDEKEREIQRAEERNLKSAAILNFKENITEMQNDGLSTMDAMESSYRKNFKYRSKKKWCFRGQGGNLGLKIRIFCEQMTSVSYPTGRLMLVLYVLLCTMSWILYIIGTIFLYITETQPDVNEALTGHPPLIIEGLCLTYGLSIINWCDLIIHTLFLIYFILKFGAAIDRNMFFFKITSVIDVLTIIGSYTAVFQPRYHMDLGFLRALNVFNFGEVLRYMGFLSSNHVIETVDIFFTMFAMWMVASGLMHFIIHLGDFWKDLHKAAQWNYLDCCYFLLVTMSTVGFGDFYPPTMTGRLYICIFIPVAIGIFATFVPEIFRKISARSERSESYQALAGHQHIVVCGHFNNISLSAVLRGFFHIEHASRRSLINMVILRVSPIDLAMRAILTKYNAWARYYQGTPADPQDLARICFRSSQGALVLAKPNSSMSVEEDGDNIMQAIALKAHSERIRVLVQLHHFRNKCLLNNFPRWTYRHKDVVICMDELKLGLLALNCLAPGFSTIILNLLNGHRIKNVGRQTQRKMWRQEYEYGVSMEVYDVSLSYEFHNLCARELTLFAYEKWNIVVCALCRVESHKPSIIINPAGYKDLKVDSLTTKAIVIAMNSAVVDKMRNYCTNCRAHETGKICQCPTRLQFFIQAAGLIMERKRTTSDDYPVSQNPEDEDIPSDPPMSDTQDTPQGRSSSPASGYLSQVDVNSPRLVHRSLSKSKSYKDRSLQQQSIMLNVDDYTPIPHRPYVPKNVDTTGCFHWIPDTPIDTVKLTLSDATRYQFKDHYLLCIIGPLAGESLNLKSFVFPLRFHWMEVRDIVILGDTTAINEEEWIKVKNIPHIFLVQGNPCSCYDLNAVGLRQCTACVILGESANKKDEDHCLRDKNTLLCAMTIRSMIEQSTRSIHMTTELNYEQNAHHFSSAESHTLDFKLPLRFQEAFARGIIFSNTLLYSSISSLYFSGAVFQFLRVLLFGTAVDDLESPSLLQHGLQLGSQITPKQTSVRVRLLSMCDLPFARLFTRHSKKLLLYKEVFTHALMCWRILCLGIYRLDRRGFRVVITNPSKSLNICAVDQIFCLIPSQCLAPSEETRGLFLTPIVKSNVLFPRAPAATFADVPTIESTRQSTVMLRNL